MARFKTVRVGCWVTNGPDGFKAGKTSLNGPTALNGPGFKLVHTYSIH